MEPWSLGFSGVAFGLASLTTIVGGARLARTGDQLADRTGMGEAFRDTVIDERDADRSDRSTPSLWVEFIVVGVIVAASGWVIARAAEAFVVTGGLEASLVGVLFTGIVNATPEAVTSIAAVRRGALTLAVAGVLGGNAFDVLNLVVADVAFRQASMYHAAGHDELFLLFASTLLTSIILAGMLRRELRGPARIGIESWVVLALYLASITLVASTNGR